MPLVTLTVRKPKSSAFKSTVLDAVHAALISSGVPATDKFQRVIELEADDFRFDPSTLIFSQNETTTSYSSKSYGPRAGASKSRRSCSSNS